MTKLEITIQLDQFEPRPYQKPIFDAFLNKGYKKLMCIWPRRCLHGETHITMADGSFKFLKDIKIGDSILSWTGSSFKSDIVKNAWKTEPKKTLTINAKAWPSIITSEDHLFAACFQNRNVNWYKASDLTSFHQLQLYGGIECGPLHDPDLAEFIGYMITDGYISGYQQPKFTNVNIDILKRVEYLAFKLFNITAVWRVKGNGYDLGLTNGSKGGGHTPNKVKMLFRDYSLDVPKNIRPIHPLVWKFDRESLGRFLSAVISCDGSIYTHKESVIHDNKRDRHSIVKPYTEISISCGKSHSYGWGMYWLLRKIGIQSQIPKLEHGGSNFKISIGRHDQINALLSYGPIYGKEDKQKIALDIIANRELTPYALYNGCYRSQIDKIKLSDTSELYDIETEKNHNFIANGYVVHNSGKDLVALQLLLRAALTRVGIYFMVYPTYNQAKKIVWDGMTNTGKKFIDYIPKELIENINSTEMKIILKNGSLIQLVGSSDAGDRIVGSNPVGIVFSEFALCDPQCYFLCRPMLNANNGWAIILSTPRGHNTLYTLFEIARQSPEWYVSKLTLDDTLHIPKELVEHEVETGEISRDLSLQEYYTSWSCGLQGAFYGSILDNMKLKGQVTYVPYEPTHRVNTSWDIGLDTTAIIFFQIIGSQVRIIDYYENQNLPLDHYIKIIKNKEYIYNKHIGPHDIANREYTSGVSRIEIARRLDVRFTVAPNLSIDDGIEAVKAMLAKTWIDEVNCKSFLVHIEQYRQQWNERTKVYTGRPEHDIHSHCADALRMLAVTLNKVSTMSDPEALEKRYREACLGINDRLPSVFRTDLPNY